LKTYCEIILVCCILHNFCRDLPVHCDDDNDDDDDNDGDDNDGDDSDEYDGHEESDETVQGQEHRIEFFRSSFLLAYTQ